MSPAVLRRTDLAAAALLLAQAAVLTVVLAATGRVADLPVVVDLRGASGVTRHVDLVHLNGAAAAVLLLALTGLARLVLVAGPLRVRRDAALARNLHGARWLEFALTSSIRLFLIAQLNGVVELGALVPMYAATSMLVLAAVLQERVRTRAGHPLLPLCFGAAVGIVPWGVVAFYQVGGTVAGDGPSAAVRVTTLLLLAAAFAFFVLHWREQRRAAGAERGCTGRSATEQAGSARAGVEQAGAYLAGEVQHGALSTVAASLFAWLVVLGIAAPVVTT